MVLDGNSWLLARNGTHARSFELSKYIASVKINDKHIVWLFEWTGAMPTYKDPVFTNMIPDELAKRVVDFAMRSAFEDLKNGAPSPDFREEGWPPEQIKEVSIYDSELHLVCKREAYWGCWPRVL